MQQQQPKPATTITLELHCKHPPCTRVCSYRLIAQGSFWHSQEGVVPVGQIHRLVVYPWEFRPLDTISLFLKSRQETFAVVTEAPAHLFFPESHPCTLDHLVARPDSILLGIRRHSTPMGAPDEVSK